MTAYDAQSEASPFLLAQALREKHGIAHLDIVVPNAAISKIYPLAREVRRADIVEHVEVNVLGVVSLFQATRDLLQASPSKKPVFAIMGSGAGSLGLVLLPLPFFFLPPFGIFQTRIRKRRANN